MFGFLTYENQLSLVDSIVKSSSDLILIIKDKVEPDEIIHSTVKQILIFIEKIILLLPKILISQHNLNNLKDDLVISFHAIQDTWENFLIEPQTFYDTWEKFVFCWDEFSRFMKMIQNENNSIYKSLN